ncbi:MAG TPA: hypothetical protein VFX95_01480, partial [Caulobacteraceae bacterium]|nr:hypothetical protein [Caulobacteraceae bacterium]
SLANAGYAFSDAKLPDAPLGRLEKCSPTGELAFVLDGEGENVFIVKLRSLDQVITFLGDGLREGNLPLVTSWEAPDGAASVPLFAIQTDATSKGWQDDDFAAVLDYRGKQVRAGPGRIPPAGHDPNGWRGEEQTSTVLSILTQLYSLIPADDALRPPNRITFN